MVSFNELIFVAIVATTSSLAFPTTSFNTELTRRAWPIQPQILICKNNIAAKDAYPIWSDIRIKSEAAECAVHGAPINNDVTNYPHLYLNGADKNNPTKYIYAPLMFPNPRCNLRGVELRSFPLLHKYNKKTQETNYPPYELNKKPKPDPGEVRVIYTVQDKEFCGVIAHERKNEGLFHLCRPEAEWKANGWTYKGREVIPPDSSNDTEKDKKKKMEDLPEHLKKWFAGELGPENGWPEDHKRPTKPRPNKKSTESAASTVQKRATKKAPACPPGICPRGQATIGPQNKCQKCPAGQVPDAAQEECVKCGAGESPDAAGHKCIREKKCPVGTAKIGTNRTCQKCPKGKEPTPDQTACQDACKAGEIRKADKKCEKCAAGQKADPTRRKCIDKTPEEKKAEEEEKRKQEEERKKKEEEKKRKEEEEAKKKEEERKKKEEEEKKKQEEELKEKKRTRVSKCMAFISSSFYLEDAGLESLTEEEIDEASGEWPEDVPYVEGDITDDNIIGAEPRRRIVRRRFGGLVKLLSKLGGKTTKTKLTGPALKAEKLKTVKNTRNFRDCLMLMGSTIGDAVLKFDPPGGYEPVPDVDGERPYLMVYKDEDDRDGALTLQAYNDRDFHKDRLELNKCTHLYDEYENAATGFDAHKVCCIFYIDYECKNSIFKAKDRQDGELTGDENDVISSFMCTSLADDCKGLPP